ncbi:MAG TPA: tetratricopeptide repeat protein [Isosphaeraceae bacterium]|nr:tetratricopeptide repeat protein [Isosphaeraceae bacterium]
MTIPDKGRVGASRPELAHFTDREPFLEIFRRLLAAPQNTALPVLAFHGVGGVGKTALLNRLAQELEELHPPLPHARFNVENLKSEAMAARECLLRFRADLESAFGLRFPSFDLLLSVLLAGEGGPPPPLVALNPDLKDAINLVTGLFGIPSATLGAFLARQATRSEAARRLLARAGGREEITSLRERARRDDPALADELIDRFADELAASLPARTGRACRGVLFFDTFETLWKGSDAGRSYQGRQLDAWLRQLCRSLRQRGVLVVVAGRYELRWAEDEADWKDAIESHLLGGLSRHDAQIYLSRRTIGPSPWTPQTPFQTAILDTCSSDVDSLGEPSCHPYYLALCADIVDNFRAQNAGADPPVDMFTGLPGDQVARLLADRFLKSLPDERWELWVKELSLTPSFDESAALELDRDRHHNLGRAGWKHFCRYSFLEPQPEGHFRLHKTMRDVLRNSLGDDSIEVHAWFRDHWAARDERALAFFHRWSLDPEAMLKAWRDEHEGHLKERRIVNARASLDDWSEIALDGGDRQRLGDVLWARMHHGLGNALHKTPIAPPAPALKAAIAHYELALGVWSESDFPLEWARTQNNLGIAYGDLPTGDRVANLARAIACYEAALRVYTESASRSEWAVTQNNLGNAYNVLPTGDRVANLARGIACYESALRVYTESDFPPDWATTQNNLGAAYGDLPTGDRVANLARGIACYEAALRVRTESDFPLDWAMTQYNLGLALRELGRLEEALAAFVCAARGYASVRDREQADEANAEAEATRRMKGP